MKKGITNIVCFHMNTFVYLCLDECPLIWCMIYRDVYEYMIKRQKEKGRSRSGKGESFSVQQIQLAREEYDEEATLFIFRLKSLKQGQSRSLLTQAARHHAAQVFFFFFLPFFLLFIFIKVFLVFSFFLLEIVVLLQEGT